MSSFIRDICEFFACNSDCDSSCRSKCLVGPKKNLFKIFSRSKLNENRKRTECSMSALEHRHV